MTSTKIIRTGRLKVKTNDPSKWMVGNFKFTVNVKSNDWIVRELIKLRRAGRQVEAWLSDENTLLSIRAL